MNGTNILAIVTMAVVGTLLGATSIGNAFAGGDDSLATSQVNDCGNGELPLNVFCQNINSQVQGDDNEQEDVFGQQNNGGQIP
jgi:hypothetical protein